MSEPKALRIAFLDVSQGDATVVSCPETNEAIVIDCVDASRTIEYLKNQKIKHLRGVVITHPHSDHMKEVHSLIQNIENQNEVGWDKIVVVPSIQWSGRQKNDEDGHSTFKKPTSLFQMVHEKTLIKRWETVKAGIQLPLNCDWISQLKLLHPNEVDLTIRGLDANNLGLIILVSGISSRALLMADLEESGWMSLSQRVGANDSEITCDVLKFPHHGAWIDKSNSGLLSSLLDTTKPSCTVISVGPPGEKYDHPNNSVLRGLVSRKIRVLFTNVTKTCSAKYISSSDQVQKAFAENTTIKFQPSARACACSGTVIIDLDVQATVVQPKQTFHMESVIRPHFETAMCIV